MYSAGVEARHGANRVVEQHRQFGAPKHNGFDVVAPLHVGDYTYKLASCLLAHNAVFEFTVYAFTYRGGVRTRRVNTLIPASSNGRLTKSLVMVKIVPNSPTRL